jgi:hypothetical protein
MNSSSAGRLPRRSSLPIAPAVPQSSNGNSKMTISVNSNSQAPSIFGLQQGWSDQVADSKILKSTPALSSTSSGSFAPIHHDSVKFVHSTMEILENQIKREEAPKKKRTRTSSEQLRILQRAFSTDPMPSSSARLTLSKRLGMNPRAVQVWFQNRRAKEKLDARRAELGLTGTTSFTDSNEREDLSDFEGGEDSVGASVDIEELNEASPNGHEQENAGSSNLFNSLRATGMMQRFANHSHAGSNTGVKTQRSASTPNGFMFTAPSNSGNSGNFSSSPSSSNSAALPFHQHHHHQQQSFFPASSSFLADVNEASVDELYGDLGTGSSTSPSEVVPLEFYGSGLVVDRTPSVSPVGFGAGRAGNFFASPFGDDLLMSSVFPGISGLGLAMNNMSVAGGFMPSNNTNTTSIMRNPQAANVFLSSFQQTTQQQNQQQQQQQQQTQNSRRSYSLPEAHISLSPAQLQSLEHFAFPSPLLSSIEESPVGELLEGNEKRVFSEFLENEVMR